jgi:hypothetical protein
MTFMGGEMPFGRIDLLDGGHPLGAARPGQASSVSTIQPATADGSIASMRSIMPP